MPEALPQLALPLLSPHHTPMEDLQQLQQLQQLQPDDAHEEHLEDNDMASGDVAVAGLPAEENDEEMEQEDPSPSSESVQPLEPQQQLNGGERDLLQLDASTNCKFST